MTTLSIYDGTGTKRDAAWLQASYGDVRVSGSGGEVVLLENTGGSASLVVTWLDAEHEPLAGRDVTFGWPDGQVIGVTNAEGAVGFGMGGGAYYHDAGPHYVESGGVRVQGLGFKWGTNHHHLDVVLVEGEPEPPEPEPPEPEPPEPEPPEPEPPEPEPPEPEPPEPEPVNYWTELLHKLDLIIALLVQIRDRA